MSTLKTTHRIYRSGFLWLILILQGLGGFAHAQSQGTDYQFKAAFLYNFILYTEWADNLDKPIRVCTYGGDPFGEELDKLQGKSIERQRVLLVARIQRIEDLRSCNVVFIHQLAISNMDQILPAIHGQNVLTVADSAGALQKGVMINMYTKQSKVVFEVNLKAAQSQGINLSSKLLRLATEVIL